MNFQHIETYWRAGEQALGFYGFAEDCRLTLLHRSENATFLVTGRDSGINHAVIRVSRPGYHTLEEILAEVQWLDRIMEDGTVRIARPIRSRDGQAVTCVDVDGQSYHCLLCEYLEGEAPAPESGERGFWWLKKAGEAAAKLHRQTMAWEEGRQLSRPVWDYQALLGPDALFGDWRVCRELGASGTRLLEEACKVIERKLSAYGKDVGKFGLIHTDLRAANLLVEKGEIKVLDFDDCGYGWHLFDLAASVSFVEDRPEVYDWLTAWVEGYTSVKELEEQDYRMIPTFLMTRRLQLLAWITSHDDSDPVRVYYEGFADGTFRMAEQYLGKNIE